MLERKNQGENMRLIKAIGTTLIYRIFCLLACGVFLQTGLGTASATADANPATDNSMQAGHTKFNAADRFAITNVIMAMTNGLDEKNLKQLVSNLTPEFSVEYRLPGLNPIKIEGRDNFGKMMAKRFENLNADGIERRHIISPLYFIEQSPNSARILIQIITCSATYRANWFPMSSAKVEFQLVKHDDLWLCSRQLETLDCPLDLSVSKVLPLPAGMATEPVGAKQK